ncbi:MAG: 4Fe-4S dicluster domain-containing protein [Chloroflexota bacterium]|nr:4Fe-4S dicluster domain-containing protein [Chloroflexota bacterium]
MANLRKKAGRAGGVPKLPRSGVVKVDRHICLTCRECEVGCSLYHEEECNPALSRIRIEFNDFVPGFPSLYVCKQCAWPACYYACADILQESAILIDRATGARFIDEDRCIGCGACLRACPLTPEMQVVYDKIVDGRRVYYKCDLCKDRAEGPICVEACPAGALTFVPARDKRKRDG